MVERRFRRDVRALEAIFTFVTEFAASEQISDDQRYDVDLILEELFTNMVKYSRPAAQDIAIGLERRGAALIITMKDFDVEKFDVTAPREKANGPAAELPSAGGRGLDLIRHYADDIRYDYRDRNSTIIVTKRLDP
jgi:anti-sigma regulatory factor (Ser/Thr protein kinase)